MRRDRVPLLWTRPAGEPAPDGVTHAPCIEFIPLDPPIPRVEDADLLVCSPRAAAEVARRRAALPARWRALAIGPATAAALEARGVTPVEVGEGGARALAARARPDAAVVVATSDLGGAEARAARPDAVLWPLYRTALAETLPAAAREALRGTFDVWFGSPSAVEGFARLAPGALARARCVYTFGATTRDEVVARGRADATPVSDAGSAPRPLTDR